MEPKPNVHAISKLSHSPARVGTFVPQHIRTPHPPTITQPHTHCIIFLKNARARLSDSAIRFSQQDRRSVSIGINVDPVTLLPY